jgi:phosphoribosylformimino-5-aminoimidazole carboxamide ribotide isomerase
MSDIISSIIPVMDLMIGQVVWAKGGNRDAYRPLESRLTNSSQPLDVAKAIFAQTGCDWLYVADIDSFAGANPSWPVFESLTDSGFRLLIDANWLLEQRIDQAIERFGDSDNVKLIVSTETIRSADQFSVFQKLIGAGITPVFSLDMRGPEIIAKDSDIARLTPLELVHQAWQAGVRHLIQLDLTTVGQGASDCNAPVENGLDDQRSDRLSLLREIADELPELVLISGGGMRNDKDCQQILSSGCQHVLVASAIYEGRLTPDDIAYLTPYRSDQRTRAAIEKT